VELIKETVGALGVAQSLLINRWPIGLRLFTAHNGSNQHILTGSKSVQGGIASAIGLGLGLGLGTGTASTGVGLSGGCWRSEGQTQQTALVTDSADTASGHSGGGIDKASDRIVVERIDLGRSKSSNHRS
jgi:hypothetical protein